VIDRRLTQQQRIKGKEIKADPQRHLIYSMERTFVGSVVGSGTRLQVLEDVVAHACREWRVPAPTIGVEKRKRVYGACTESEIRLNPDYDGMTMGVVLHELAHWITDRKYGHLDLEDHGEYFAGVYRYLLDRYNFFPSIAFDALAKQFGVMAYHGVRPSGD